MIEVALGGALVRVQRSRARPMRPITLNRKNALFAGSDQGGVHWGVIASLIETCKPANSMWSIPRPTSTTPSAASTATASQIDPLMPWPTSGPWETSAYDANG
jgi:transposase